MDSFGNEPLTFHNTTMSSWMSRTTEVLAEGVNLHRSNIVINYNIPWNPTRLIRRDNRVDTKFSKIYAYNFFPTEEGTDLIKLRKAAEAKIHAFIEMRGADTRLLTDGEEIKSHDLFAKLNSKKTITRDDENEETEMQYFTEIRKIRGSHPDLFERIKHLAMLYGIGADFTVMKPQLIAILGAVILPSVVTSIRADTVHSLLPFPDTAFQVADRGQDHATFQAITQSRDSTGNGVIRTNQFTLLENSLHYFDQGEWKLSEDLIESSTAGAQAVRSPHKAAFSDDLNVKAVFDIQAPDGRWMRGGVRAIQLTDVSSGKSLVIGTVKDSVKGQILPPNQILWTNAFNGIHADVLIVWQHNLFSQDVVLLERPLLPPGWNPATVRLEVVTEFMVDADPELRTTVGTPNQVDEDDHMVIHFGSLAMVMGKAYPVTQDEAFSPGTIATRGTPVHKHWHKTNDGKRFLIESVSWSDAAAFLNNLPLAGQAGGATETVRAPSLGRIWPQRPSLLGTPRPLQTSVVSYKPEGYIIDFVIVPDQGTPTVLASGQTYYVKTSYYSGSAVTFQPGCIIKFKNNAYMLLYGTVSFPSAGQLMPVFTSRNDDSFGDLIRGVGGETDSNGDPNLHRASQAIWIYYKTVSTAIRNATIRWAQRGIQYDTNPGVDTNPTIADCLFQNCQIGLYLNMPSGSVTLSNVKQCNVITPIRNGGFDGVSGSMISNCGEDTDGDGLDDAWELAHFGNLAQTCDGDPDGDGLPNLAEFLLLTNPSIPDNPLNLNNIVGTPTLAGLAEIELPISPIVIAPPLTLLVNGSGAAHAFLDKTETGKWAVFWDTTIIPNATYTITLSINYQAQPLSSLQPIRASGASRSVSVFNPITFDSVTTVFSDLLTISGILTVQSASYRIELYNPNGSLMVQSPTLTTSDGTIFANWNLKDNNGTQISFDNIRALIYVNQQPPVTKWYNKEASTVADGFVVAWGWNQYTSGFNQKRTDLMLNGVINIISNPSLDNEYTPLAPPQNAFSSGAFRYNSLADAETLLSALANTANGNFFWFGHGNSDAIQGNVKVSNISTGDIENRLKNKAHRSIPRRDLNYKNEHFYRLVILNGCYTYSSDFANAFGIDFTPPGNQINSVATYNALARFPRAFVGWTDTIDVPAHNWLFGIGDSTQHAKYAEALAVLFSDWMSGQPLFVCLSDFGDRATANGFEGARSYAISGCVDLRRPRGP